MGFKKAFDRREYRYYDYYWKVECADGQKRDVEVPHHLWKRAKAGTPVRKDKGER